MFENQKILNKVEAWCDRLPYRTLKIEIELPDQTLVLNKSKQRVVGFAPPPDTSKQTPGGG